MANKTKKTKEVKRYLVTRRAVYTDQFYVYATGKREAVQKMLDNEGEYIEDSHEYGDTLGSSAELDEETD